MMTYLYAGTDEHFRHARALFHEYATSLNFDLDFQDFTTEVENLPGMYTPPGGFIILALDEDIAIGCVALKRISDETCEMKRLYVTPQFRGRDVGKRLAIMAIEEGRRIGYRFMRLDTVPAMKEAVGLYYALGFKQIRPYRYNPIEGAMFMELELAQARIPRRK